MKKSLLRVTMLASPELFPSWTFVHMKSHYLACLPTSDTLMGHSLVGVRDLADWGGVCTWPLHSALAFASSWKGTVPGAWSRGQDVGEGMGRQADGIWALEDWGHLDFLLLNSVSFFSSFSPVFWADWHQVPSCLFVHCSVLAFPYTHLPFLKKFIYLAVLGLSCSTWDLHCGS